MARSSEQGKHAGQGRVVGPDGPLEVGEAAVKQVAQRREAVVTTGASRKAIIKAKEAAIRVQVGFQGRSGRPGFRHVGSFVG
jgi:hypothetical protein